MLSPFILVGAVALVVLLGVYLPPLLPGSPG
jgi:hypothetical protein